MSDWDSVFLIEDAEDGYKKKSMKLATLRDAIEANGGGGNASYAETIGDNSSTEFQVTHDLGTQDLIVQLWDLTGTDPVEATGDASSIEVDDDDNITITFGSAPDTDSYRVVVVSDGGSGGSGDVIDWTVEAVDTGPDQDMSTSGTYHHIAAMFQMIRALYVDEATVYTNASGDYALLIDGAEVWSGTLANTGSTGTTVTFTDAVVLPPGGHWVEWRKTDGDDSLYGRDADYDDDYMIVYADQSFVTSGGSASSGSFCPGLVFHATHHGNWDSDTLAP
ncbi:MAG: hypothetical protein ACLFWH_15165 [Actinomycetota bacterium]